MCTACSCGTADAVTAPQAEAVARAADANVYTVGGMTCGHCVSSVSAEIGKVGGVTGVSVDLPTGVVTVRGTGFSTEEIRQAVDRAGYVLADASPTDASPAGAS
ncbi:copper chaperone CopZ [Streptosporangium becharense]|uniref:Copper chaperone CopZ n=1 Tax=Streptosporangium becharense TaxID=1816182 RepID=A0A7W9IB18_9ACTN|nr:heavy-metal-associated domain-containing protein [Streptosporangium becharense]MBB2910745.1 copper chaperone CopZ [Streptosporangium becharense]MBB5817440.1 copper chaperone CopZ [Streptosporangium becharense]